MGFFTVSRANWSWFLVVAAGLDLGYWLLVVDAGLALGLGLGCWLVHGHKP
jgi:hypothetical protein